MFGKILIANRGEIACRIIRTARRMGIGTVAVYSDADARALHAQMADEAVRIGPAPASDSYLDSDRILAAALATGADAIHPGYGFLSERASFATACAEAGITFIGPPPSAIAAMGDKIESKKLARMAGVNVVPGRPGAIEDVAEALGAAAAIGYPVMMKASAGGGGKGMRVAWHEADVRDGFDAVRREALASFGDDRVLLEKFIERPRHIEIQLLGDQHGTILHLGERECSIQRRHQKVVEEAPSPFVTPAMRQAMGEQAISLARAVGYHSAGTVELIVSGADPSGQSFYFLEMNTRLQVEHPVTEAVTGLDLVEQMIRVAAGERLGFTQADVRLNGWAVETRVYAEDPYRGFLPSTGRLARYRPPERAVDPANSGMPRRVRVDDGVEEGDTISRFYDPMIAKLITWAPERNEAIDAQRDALDAFVMDGPATNTDFLSALMQHPRFRSGDLATGFIDEEYPTGFTGAPASPALLRGLAALAVLMATARARGPIEKQWSVRIDGRDFAVTHGGGALTVDGEAMALSHDYAPGRTSVRLLVEDEWVTVQAARTRTGFILRTRGARHEVRALPQRIAAYARHLREENAQEDRKQIIAPMSGLLVRLDVRAGDAIVAGQALGVIEAMKMENVLRAPGDGTVAAVRAAAGQSVATDQVLVDLV
ncbi:acetyl-CoA carboxylase biotin carboxylase subunit [Sphingomonas mucosissima]|uniref:propionyl-CoA carboxylase n=1 Tax=Sphingomonas mucosissima TaxID=370959 RepID=A0A245ZHA7_9SPHN|nr:acetyl/propionyl/methylcrotonyl-CoA carboxylase subunit alpha [Sphingomonas mucosissima]OWK29131.1 acetyl-/propionyl-coenzyme A carboxylase alpha chain [Sphingomonas mucosissima]